MQRWMCALALVGCLLVGCKSSGDTAQGDAGANANVEAKTCVCETAQKDDGWCDHCGKGYVGGKEVACKGCVESAKSGTECQECANKKAQ